MYFCDGDPPLDLLAEEIVGRRTPPRDAIGSDWSESLCWKSKSVNKSSIIEVQSKLTAWFNIPTETLLIPMPEVDDFPTDEALRFGRFLVVLRSFGDFALDGEPLANPSERQKSFNKWLKEISSKEKHIKKEWEHAAYHESEASLHILRLTTQSNKVKQKKTSFYLFPYLSH